MKTYGVSKQYGHFTQIWYVEAESKEEAWQIAEEKGHLQYQTVYDDIYPSRNYVTCIGGDDKNGNTISTEQYNEWLQEAVQLGMKVDGYNGLPFNDVR